MIPSPGRHTRRAAFYQQLSQLTAAGIPLIGALELQERSAPEPALRPALARVRLVLESGGTFADALQACPSAFPEFDLALLDAGERSGRLPACFQLLSAHYEQSARLLRQMLSGLLYPVFLFHLAVIIGPLPTLFRTGNLLVYGLTVLAWLVPAYVVAAAASWLTAGTKGAALAGPVESLLHRVPLLGAARRNLALARLAAALEALLSAGVPILQAWPLAAKASSSPALQSAVAAWQPRLESGTTPAEALRATRVFPDLFAGLYDTGERTGTLDDTLRRLTVLHQEEGSRQMKALADWTPKIIYLGVAAFVAWQVIRFWTGYFNGIQRAIDF